MNYSQRVGHLTNQVLQSSCLSAIKKYDFFPWEQGVQYIRYHPQNPVTYCSLITFSNRIIDSQIF